MKEGYTSHKLGTVHLGEGSVIDEDAVLGYLSPRRGVSAELTIGANARIRSGCVIYAGSRIGSHLETGHHTVIREENEIGDHFSIWNSSVVDYGCRIGMRVKVHCHVYIAQFTVIEDDVFLAPGVRIANDYHPGCPDSKECMRGPSLRKGCRIGVNVTLLPYVTVGAGTLVGSGSVVTKDLPPGVVAYGNPARVHGTLEEMRCKTGRREAPYL
jgi:acetyltransferase-like isoleucine patch superfamily enzyme